MKSIFVTAFVILTSFLNISVFGQDETARTILKDHIDCKHRIDNRTQQDLLTSRNYTADQTDLVYQEMHLALDPSINHIACIIRYQFKSLIPDLTQLILDCDTNLIVHSIRRGNTDLTFMHADNLLTIDLGLHLAEGQFDSIVISYEGDEVLNHNMHNGYPILCTSLSLLTLWYPGKKDLIDKLDSVDIYVTTPSDHLAAGNGTLVSITPDSGRLIHHWRHRHPIANTYLLNVAVTNYVSVQDSMTLPDGMVLPLLNYIYPEDLAEVLEEVSAIPDIMTFFIEKFGAYPFADEKYGHAQYSDGGALEVQTMSFMGFWDFNVLAHELAHQWFGNFVTFGSLSDMWLSEGWAEYLEGLAVEQLRPSNWTGLKNQHLNSITSLPGGSVFVEDTTDANQIFDSRLTYSKGFYLAHMLRWLVGDSMFYEACYNYLHDPDHADGFARQIDLQRHFEAVSDLDLDDFFADWYYGEGYPSYTIRWTQEQDSIIFWVEQEQSHPSVSFFEMPIPIIAHRFVVIADTVFNHTYNHQRFSLYVGNQQINQIIFDLDKWILSKYNKLIKLTTAVGDPSPEDPYDVFPNPASAFLEVTNGEDIYKAELITTGGISHTRLMIGKKVNVRYLPAGHYTLLLHNHDDVVVSSQSVIIQH